MNRISELHVYIDIKKISMCVHCLILTALKIFQLIFIQVKHRYTSTKRGYIKLYFCLEKKTL